MSAKILTYKRYVAGWLDSSIHDFLEALPPTSSSMKYALITCLDSNSNPSSLLEKSPELKSISRRLQVVGQGLLLPTELLLATDCRNQIFFGFDEVWFFPNKRIQPKPESASLVGPARLNQSRFKKLGKWIVDNSCSLALGGGEGLNFVVPASGLAMFMLGYSIEQREPSLAS
jgi:hypothetical protein